jgi:hypothetical protein
MPLIKFQKTSSHIFSVEELITSHLLKSKTKREKKKLSNSRTEINIIKFSPFTQICKPLCGQSSRRFLDCIKNNFVETRQSLPFDSRLTVFFQESGYRSSSGRRLLFHRSQKHRFTKFLILFPKTVHQKTSSQHSSQQLISSVAHCLGNVFLKRKLKRWRKIGPFYTQTSETTGKRRKRTKKKTISEFLGREIFDQVLTLSKRRVKLLCWSHICLSCSPLLERATVGKTQESLSISNRDRVNWRRTE